MSVAISGEQFLPQCSGTCGISQFRGQIINATATVDENIRILLKNTDITSTIIPEYPGGLEIVDQRPTVLTTRADAKVWFGDDFLGTWALLPNTYVSVTHVPNTDEQVALRIVGNVVITIKFFFGDSTDINVPLTAEQITKMSTFTYIVTAIQGMVGIPNMFNSYNFIDDGAVFT